MTRHIRNTFILLLLGFLTILMVRITLPYLSLDDQVAFLRIKQWIIHNRVWKTAFYIHVFSSIFLLGAGFTQFSTYVLRNHRKLHRWVGRMYVGIILCLSGPAGLIMAIYANGGWLSQLAFSLLSVLWWGTTLVALQTARRKKIQAHRAFMIRSFALTASALTLRSWKWALVLLFHPSPMSLYMLVAWLGWVPNLLFAEWLIWRRGGKPFWMHARSPSQKPT